MPPQPTPITEWDFHRNTTIELRKEAEDFAQVARPTVERYTAALAAALISHSQQQSALGFVGSLKAFLRRQHDGEWDDVQGRRLMRVKIELLSERATDLYNLQHLSRV